MTDYMVVGPETNIPSLVFNGLFILFIYLYIYLFRDVVLTMLN